MIFDFLSIKAHKEKTRALRSGFGIFPNHIINNQILSIVGNKCFFSEGLYDRDVLGGSGRVYFHPYVSQCFAPFPSPSPIFLGKLDLFSPLNYDHIGSNLGD